jgi:transcription elongation factor GreA
MSDNKLPMTERGKKLLADALENYEVVERPRVSADVAEFRSHGDLSENAPYHAAREEMGMIEAKIGQLKDILSRGFVVDRSKLPEDMIVFGTKVTLENRTEKIEECWYMVGEGEQDADRGFILVTSPLGQELMTRELSEEFTAELPNGKVDYFVKTVSFWDDDEIAS